MVGNVIMNGGGEFRDTGKDAAAQALGGGDDLSIQGAQGSEQRGRAMRL